MVQEEQKNLLVLLYVVLTIDYCFFALQQPATLATIFYLENLEVPRNVKKENPETK